jgi:hypothetical protein
VEPAAVAVAGPGAVRAVAVDAAAVAAVGAGRRG